MYRTLLVALMLVLKAVVVAAQCDWKLSTEREGIKIYTGGVPGSTIKAIKVEAMFNATAAQLVALIMDVNTSPDWVYHTKSSKLIKQVSASELYCCKCVYKVLNFICANKIN